MAVLLLGSAALRGSSLVQLSEQPLRRLAEETGETVNLGVLVGDQVLYLARLRNSDLVTANIQVGSTLPAPYTSMGKLLLAYLTDAELRATLANHDFAAQAGPNAASSLDDLREQSRCEVLAGGGDRDAQRTRAGRAQPGHEPARRRGR